MGSQYYLNGDTVVGGLTYHFISGPSDRGLIREDNKRIYFIPDTSTVEYILYDFNYTVGDTIFNFYGGTSACPDSFLVVYWEDSVLASDGYHRRLNFNGFLSWVEGVGSSLYLLLPGAYVCVSGSDRLTCAMNDSLFTYAPFGYSCTNLGESNVNREKEWIIYPNPTNSQFTMEWEPETMTEFVLTDALGRVLWEMKADNAIGKRFELPTQGVYLLIGRTEEGETRVRRIVRE